MCAISWSVSVYLTFLELCTFSIIFTKPGFLANTLLILALPSFRSLWHISLCMLSFCPNCWSRWCASQVLLQPSTLRLVMNSPQASCVTRAMHGLWFLNLSNLSMEVWRANCRASVAKQFKKALSVVIWSILQSVSWKQSRTSVKRTARLAPFG